MKYTRTLLFIIIGMIILIIGLYYYYYIRNSHTDDIIVKPELPRNKAIIDILEDYSDKYKDNYLIDDIKYGKFYEKCKIISNKLLIKLGNNYKIGILSCSNHDTIKMYLSSLITNGIPIIIDEKMSIDDINYIIKDGKIDMVIVNEYNDIDNIECDKILVLDNDFDIKKDDKYLSIGDLKYEQHTNMDTIIECNHTQNDTITIIYEKKKIGGNYKWNKYEISNKNVIDNLVNIEVFLKIHMRKEINFGEIFDICKLNNYYEQLLGIFMPIISVSRIITRELDILPTIYLLDESKINNLKMKFDNHDNTINKFIGNKINLTKNGFNKIKYTISFNNLNNNEFLNNLGLSNINILANNNSGIISGGFGNNYGYKIGNIKIINNKIHTKNPCKTLYMNEPNKKWYDTEIYGFINRGGTIVLINNDLF
jgi:hypothetical protein